MHIKDIRVFPVKGNSKLKAKANVSLVNENGWEIGIKGFRIHEDDKKPAWVGVPTEKYLKDGKDEYAEIIWFNQTVQSEIYSKIIEAYKKNPTQV